MFGFSGKTFQPGSQSSSIPSTESSIVADPEKDATAYNPSRNESKSYFNNMFKYIEKAMKYALKNDDEFPLHSQDAKRDKDAPIAEFEELKNEMIKETLCTLFEEKGYPKLPQCDIHVNLPSQIKKDVLLRLSNNLRDISTKHFIDDFELSTEENSQRNDSLSRCVNKKVRCLG